MATGERGTRRSVMQIDRLLRIGRGAKVKVVSDTGVETEIDMAELAALDSIGAADLAKIDGITNGTGAAGKATVLDSSGNYTGPASGVWALPGNLMSTEAGTGITGGTGTVYKSSVTKIGGIFRTSILIDLTGLGSSTTDLDIIGTGVNPAHLGQITAARNGTIFGGTMQCLEVPAGGVTDIDLYVADENTGVFDGGIAALVETALITSGGAWSLATIKAMADFTSANKYIYLTCGAGGVPGTYTAGKFLIEFYGV